MDVLTIQLYLFLRFGLPTVLSGLVETLIGAVR